MFLVARSNEVDPVSVTEDRIQKIPPSMSSSSKPVAPQEFPQRSSSLNTFQLFKEKRESTNVSTTPPSNFARGTTASGYSLLHSKSSEALAYGRQHGANHLGDIPQRGVTLPTLKKSSTSDGISTSKSLGSPRLPKFPSKAKSSSPLQSPLSSKFHSNGIGFSKSLQEAEHLDLGDDSSSVSSGSFESALSEPYYPRKRCDSTQSNSSSLASDPHILGSTPPRLVRVWRPDFTPPVSPATTSSDLPFFRGKESVKTLGEIRVFDKSIGSILPMLISTTLVNKLRIHIDGTDRSEGSISTEDLTEDPESAEKNQASRESLAESPTSTNISWPSDLDDTSHEVILESQTGKAMVRASSLRYLVKMLACEGQNDPNYIIDFLRTYRYFADPLDVARLLIVRYLNSTISIMRRAQEKMECESSFAKQDEWDNIIQLRVLNTFKKWIDLFCEDFSLNREMTELVLLFLEEVVTCDEKRTKFADSVYEKMGERDIIPIGWLLLPSKGTDDGTQSLYHRFVQMEDGTDSISKISWGMSTVTLTPPIASSPLPASFKVDPAKTRGPIERLAITDIDPKDFAHQLTLIEQRLFFAIHLNEFFNHSWCDRAIKEKMTPHLSGFIRWFNKIAYGISGIIVTTSSSSSRVTIVKRLIQAAQICLKIHNYNGCFEIVAGLEQSSVQRLKGLWKALPNKYIQIYSHLTKVISRSDNHRTYRTCLQAAGVNVPVLPYLGFHLTDLVFAEDGNPTYISVTPNEYLPSPILHQHQNRTFPSQPKPQPTEEGGKAQSLSRSAHLINFAKFRLISKMLGEIVQYQQLPYEFTETPRIHEFIKNGMPAYSEDELHLYSLQCEPKA
ncbi:ras GEF [Basidiobolus meristosporus CBS 931.73]|uniref:Ras GEF n=1 Tax=Basidiobolus meristosporus CBS 931.73 TaxID=1314790 RepID=A0A1Y1YZR4_9FUNG|nr:ras GEF [Basidiobolus meristosporus CBS 931.73]|eukprot:ORY03532.1 ras GEF [Basidiobolus meristosporus CBS 931.73]